MKRRDRKERKAPRAAARTCLIAASVMSLLAAGVSARATDGADPHSPNTTEVASLALGGALADIAFWGDLAVVSRLPGTSLQDGAAAGFSVIDISSPQSPRELSRFTCTGGGWDVSLWEDLVFLSVDGFTSTVDGSCDSPPQYLTWTDDLSATYGFAGLKVVSIADPAHPVQVGSVSLPCSGSHAHTIVPDLDHNRLLIYAASLISTNNLGADWPPAEAVEGCDMIVEVPLGNPAGAHIIGRLPFGQGKVTQCHDVTYFAPRKLLAGACYTELRLYDLTDPAAPKLVSVMPHPLSSVHGAAFSNDGNTLVMGEERGYTRGCHGGTGLPAAGAIWFYDITTPATPVLHGFHALQREFEATSPGDKGCSAHYFNIVPTRSDRDVLVSAWFAGGMSVVDFTDIDAPKEVAYYQPDPSDPARRAYYWSAYWYRGHVYATNWLSQRQSLDVYTVNDPAIGETYRLPHLNPQSQETLVDTPLT